MDYKIMNYKKHRGCPKNKKFFSKSQDQDFIGKEKRMKLPLSVIIVTYNEEKNIENCLKGIYDWAGEIFIVDSFSTDRTIGIAKEYTDKIYQHLFESHTKQWNWAFRNLPFSFEWCLGLDTDFIIPKQLQNELRELFKNIPLDISGYFINRRHIFRGRWIRFGYYPKYLLRLFKVKEASCDERERVDMRIYVKGKTARLKNDMIEENLNDNDISSWIKKHNRYSTILAQEDLSYLQSLSSKSIKKFLFGNPDEKTIYLKWLYSGLPLYIRPFIYFFYRYFLRLGFLDGREGFVFHFLQGFWYRLIVDIKIDELRRK